MGERGHGGEGKIAAGTEDAKGGAAIVPDCHRRFDQCGIVMYLDYYLVQKVEAVEGLKPIL